LTKLTSYDLAQNHGMLDESEIDLIKRYVAGLKAKQLKIINIGAGFGTSVLAMLEVKPNAFIWSIDQKPRQIELDNIANAGYKNRVIRLLSKSQNIQWPKSVKVDCVFVDGGHTEDDVRKDIEIFKPVIKRNGLMFFHDYYHPNYGPDHLMSKVIDKMMSDWRRLPVARFLVGFKNE